MSFLTDIKSALKKKLNDRKITSDLVDSIGPEGIIGAKNMDYYTKTIGKMVSSGNIDQAKRYAQTEKYKVLNQK